MPRAIFLAPARADIREIIRYVTIQSGSTRIAEAFTARLRARCHHLADLPGTLGRDRPEFGPGLRSIVEADYDILFRHADERLQGIRILHGHRDLATLFES